MDGSERWIGYHQQLDNNHTIRSEGIPGERRQVDIPVDMSRNSSFTMSDDDLFHQQKQPPKPLFSDQQNAGLRGRSQSASNVAKPIAPVSQHTRHARRIYVGGIPPSYADEELLTAFLNTVISKGLGEENAGSYVLSM